LIGEGSTLTEYIQSAFADELDADKTPTSSATFQTSLNFMSSILAWNPSNQSQSEKTEQAWYVTPEIARPG
jgi:hypothetical protein